MAKEVAKECQDLEEMESVKIEDIEL